MILGVLSGRFLTKLFLFSFYFFIPNNLKVNTMLFIHYYLYKQHLSGQTKPRVKFA